jgi:GNAT superfamily N-acetyltransferase
MEARALSIVEITARDAYDLRRRVLREGTPSDDVHFLEDDRPDTFHLGALDAAGDVVAIATFFPSPTPWRDGARSVQLRGMAVDPSRQRRGAGRQLLEHAIARLRGEGFAALWANARDTALPFYRRIGMAVVGDGFLTHDTRLPHHVVVMDL